MTITQSANAARADLLRLDAETRRQLLRAYRPIQDRLLRELDDLLRVIAEAQARGTPISRRWLLRQERYRQLLTDVAREIQDYARITGDIVTSAQARAVELGLSSAVDLIDASLGERPPGISIGINRLPTQAITALVSNKPLNTLLEGFGVDAAERTQQVLADALALGQNPRVVRAAVRKTLGVSPYRALVISRNTLVDAHRTASHETYRANRQIVRRWRWRCARQVRTCAICWAMDGTEHDLDEPFASHVSCRCTTVPVTATWEDLGFTGIAERPRPTPGSEVFAKLDPEKQRAILGPAKYELYREGRLELRDLVAKTRSNTWGAGRREKTLKELGGRVVKPTASTWEQFKDADDADEWASKAFADWRASLTAEEQAELRDYQQTDYKKLNRDLRNNAPLLGGWDDMRDRMDSALAKGIVDRDVVVYRGFNGRRFAENLDDLVGGEISDKGYVSTSVDIDVGEKFRRWAVEEGKTPVIAEIRVPKGSHAAYMPILRDEAEDAYLYYYREFELLLPRDSRFRVVSTSAETDEEGDTIRRMVLELING